MMAFEKMIRDNVLEWPSQELADACETTLSAEGIVTGMADTNE